MKYIRTKDRISTLDHLKGFRMLEKPYQDYYSWLCENDLVIKQSNNIEELCDFAYALWEDKTFEVYDLTYDYVKLQDLSKWLARGDVLEVYYGIKTDKGLIYVAKMNEKGELELL